jgi:hypothetical protein
MVSVSEGVARGGEEADVSSFSWLPGTRASSAETVGVEEAEEGMVMAMSETEMLVEMRRSSVESASPAWRPAIGMGEEAGGKVGPGGGLSGRAVAFFEPHCTTASIGKVKGTEGIDVNE